MYIKNKLKIKSLNVKTNCRKLYFRRNFTKMLYFPSKIVSISKIFVALLMRPTFRDISHNFTLMTEKYFFSCCVKNSDKYCDQSFRKCHFFFQTTEWCNQLKTILTKVNINLSKHILSVISLREACIINISKS
jgi:hypothetical protein